MASKPIESQTCNPQSCVVCRYDAHSNVAVQVRYNPYPAKITFMLNGNQFCRTCVPIDSLNLPSYVVTNPASGKSYKAGALKHTYMAGSQNSYPNDFAWYEICEIPYQNSTLYCNNYHCSD